MYLSSPLLQCLWPIPSSTLKAFSTIHVLIMILTSPGILRSISSYTVGLFFVTTLPSLCNGKKIIFSIHCLFWFLLYKSQKGVWFAGYFYLCFVGKGNGSKYKMAISFFSFLLFFWVLCVCVCVCMCACVRVGGVCICSMYTCCYAHAWFRC